MQKRNCQLQVTHHGFGGIRACTVGDPSVQGPAASSSIPKTGRRRTRLFRGSCSAFIGYGTITSHSNEMGRQVIPRGPESGIREARMGSYEIWDAAALQSLARILWLVMDSQRA